MANAPFAYLYTVKKGYNDKPDTYEELAAIWTPREAAAFVGEGRLNFLPFGAKFVLSKVKLGRDGNPAQQGGGKQANSGYGRSGGPKPAPKAPEEAPPEADCPF